MDRLSNNKKIDLYCCMRMLNWVLFLRHSNSFRFCHTVHEGLCMAQKSISLAAELDTVGKLY